LEPQNQNSFNDIKPPQPDANFNPPTPLPVQSFVAPQPQIISQSPVSEPAEVNPQEILKAKNKFSWGHLFLTIVIVLVAMAAAGGSVWYVMNAQQKADKESYQKMLSVNSEKEKEPEIKEDKKIVAAPTLDSLKTFCKAGKEDVAVSGALIIQTENGYFGRCNITPKGVETSVLIVSKYVKDQWTKITVGTDKPSAEQAAELKVPEEIYQEGIEPEDTTDTSVEE
jgi:hypothetical protein